MYIARDSVIDILCPNRPRPELVDLSVNASSDATEENNKSDLNEANEKERVIADPSHVTCTYYLRDCLSNIFDLQLLDVFRQGCEAT